MAKKFAKRILVVRRDNIGDLVCTTPLLAGLRQRFPDAWIGALVNSYNAPVLAGNPNLNEVFAYTKLKHRAPGESWLHCAVGRLRLMLELRRHHIDDLVLAAPGYQASAERFARWVGPVRVVRPESGGAGHEVERIASCFAAWEGGVSLGPCQVFPDASRAAALASALPFPSSPNPLVALHISARKPSQRWSAENFADLARQLHRAWGARFLLFWSPGAPDNPLHPGDDEKAGRILSLAADLPIHPVPTDNLAELIAGLSLADRVVCSDGGAMHLAAGLGKPIVCFFGQSDPVRWRPWGVAHEVLQNEARDVSGISVAEAFSACQRLVAKIHPASSD
ncbi:MAG: glycosyltransferase family 9 protein [Betaproteobacteria bacterium]|nr:glycosyltransferase family 9 protein [Betaproteobacteria bacterium]